jgi:hypothetical protein
MPAKAGIPFSSFPNHPRDLSGAALAKPEGGDPISFSSSSFRKIFSSLRKKIYAESDVLSSLLETKSDSV